MSHVNCSSVKRQEPSSTQVEATTDRLGERGPVLASSIWRLEADEVFVSAGYIQNTYHYIAWSHPHGSLILRTANTLDRLMSGSR